MLCNAMQCYATLCYAMLCYAMLCYSMRRAARRQLRPSPLRKQQHLELGRRAAARPAKARLELGVELHLGMVGCV